MVALFIPANIIKKKLKTPQRENPQIKQTKNNHRPHRPPRQLVRTR
jgi:hypothetical protein